MHIQIIAVNGTSDNGVHSKGKVSYYALQMKHMTLSNLDLLYTSTKESAPLLVQIPTHILRTKSMAYTYIDFLGIKMALQSSAGEAEGKCKT